MDYLTLHHINFQYTQELYEIKTKKLVYSIVQQDMAHNTALTHRWNLVGMASSKASIMAFESWYVPVRNLNTFLSPDGSMTGNLA